MPAKLPLSIADSGAVIRTSSSRPWKNVRIVSGWTLKNWRHSASCINVAKCFLDTTGHNLEGLGLHTKWIRAQSYYHWKVAELKQLQHCPHLWGLPVPLGPMECPSVLQQPQRPNRQGAATPGTSGSNEAGRLMTSESSGKSSWMEGRAGDGSSWFDWVTCAEAGPGACKRKKTDAEQ